MEQATSLKAIASFAAVEDAESAPTTSSSWVNLTDVGGNHLGRARAFVTAPTLGNADNVVDLMVWAREGDVILPLASITMDTDTDLFPTTDLGVCPPSWSFFATVSAISGTSHAVTATVYVHRYSEGD